MNKTVLRKKPEMSFVIQEMREHGGEFVALDAERNPIAYGTTEDELEAKLVTQGLRLNDLLISRVPDWDCGLMF